MSEELSVIDEPEWRSLGRMGMGRAFPGNWVFVDSTFWVTTECFLDDPGELVTWDEGLVEWEEGPL